jgi:hypothetical protein
MNIMQNKTQLMQRCMAQLEKTITLSERIKILKVLTSTATMLISELETISTEPTYE